MTNSLGQGPLSPVPNFLSRLQSEVQKTGLQPLPRPALNRPLLSLTGADLENYLRKDFEALSRTGSESL
jgi:hypothetical protein